MDSSIMEIDSKVVSAGFDAAETMEEPEKQTSLSRTYLRDGKSMNKTLADVKEYRNAYVFVVDMPGLKSDQIKIRVEEEKVMVVSGERKLDKDKDERDGVRILRMERKRGKLMKKFELAENADLSAISSMYEDGVFTVTVEKKPIVKTTTVRNIVVQVG
ncbi:18.8 kDa class II heat shock protein-like [Vitis riparia]|uniref:18.8 kDa class II heat shock protein-like n=1 Tax=Vitis riparia TaxID=96939 RepID=UPI00155AD65B|nr:18.8 kDa class II heat shock protein-like [Vitis riparia]